MRYIAIFLLTLVNFTVHAEIHKEAFPTETGMQFRWWPIMPKVEGWVHDRQSSLNYSINAQVPLGKSFSDSETIIYSRAVYKPRVPNLKTLEAFIENDKITFLKKEPSISIKELKSFKNQQGINFRSFSFLPTKTGNWERVAYSEEGDFYLVFTISSRSEHGLEENINSYDRFLSKYAKKL